MGARPAVRWIVFLRGTAGPTGQLTLYFKFNFLYSTSTTIIIIPSFLVHPATLPCQVFNRKSGSYEDRTHVWVHVGFRRENFDENRAERESSFLKQTKDPTEAQVKEAQVKVAAFVSC